MGAKAVDDATLVGMNVLGRLLMELREKFRAPGVDELKRVEAPAIPGILLYGKPVGAVCAADVQETDLYSTEPTIFPSPEPAVPQSVVNETRSNGVIPKECKRLAEVDFPIAVVSKHSAREKSIRHGHPSTLHLWWARRPLAACRSMLMALLLPDPEDKHCPAEFKIQARRIIEESRLPGKKPKTDADLRAHLLAFIGDFADWDNSGNRTYLETGPRAGEGRTPGGDPPWSSIRLPAAGRSRWKRCGSAATPSPAT